VDRDGELYQEAAPWRALHAEQLGGCSADRDGLVGLRGRRARVRGGAGLSSRSGVGRQVLLGWCCDRPCLDAAWSLEEVDHAVLVAGGTCSVPLLCGLPAGPARGQGLGVAVVPGGGPWIQRLADPPARVQVPRQWLGWSSEIQGACSSTIRRVA